MHNRIKELADEIRKEFTWGKLHWENSLRDGNQLVTDMMEPNDAKDALLAIREQVCVERQPCFHIVTSKKDATKKRVLVSLDQLLNTNKLLVIADYLNQEKSLLAAYGGQWRIHPEKRTLYRTDAQSRLFEKLIFIDEQMLDQLYNRAQSGQEQQQKNENRPPH